jgi:hypothetical protein
MTRYQHPLWGFSFELPSDWKFNINGDQVTIDRQSQTHLDDGCGSLQVRAEWNGTLQSVEPIWTRHAGKLASIFGAREVGSAPWSMAGATGVEAEVQLPKKGGVRLWAGVLTTGYLVLQFAVTHVLEKKKELDPIYTRLISSLRFVDHIGDLKTNLQNIPLPPGCSPADPTKIVNEITDPQIWEAYREAGSIGALQAFYQRELPQYGWNVLEFVPFPVSSFGFARFKLEREAQFITLGIMPSGEAVSNGSPAAVIIKST